MRFALLGNHPDGLAMARALSAAGKSLVAVCETPVPDFAASIRPYSDIEDLLADPAVETVIVAGPLEKRFEQLRRVLQSERGAFCVHPCDAKVDRAYEAAWIQGETKQSLVPLLPNSLHGAVARFAEIVRGWGGFSLLKWESAIDTSNGNAFGGWDVLRKIGGEIVEVSGFASGEEVTPSDPLLFHGKFESGSLIQVVLLPGSHFRQRIAAHSIAETLELDGPDETGAARLRRIHSNGETIEESFEPWDRWGALAAAPDRVTWQDAIRALELDDALRRSVERRKASDLEYRDVNEDAAGKGTLTLIGCGMIWLILLVFGLSIWVPAIRWAIVPMLLGFFALLAIRWLGKRP